jgi:valyl-tRNA synthetase
MVGTTEFAILLEGLVDMAAEAEKAKAEIARLEGFLKGIEKKLSNEKFVANAPAAVVEMEKKKKADAETKIQKLKQICDSVK